MNRLSCIRGNTRTRNAITGYAYLLPWLIGFLLLQIFPLVSSLYYSFTNYSIIGSYSWVGLDNFRRAINGLDINFWNSVRVTCIRALFAVPLKLGFALVIAIILNMNLKGIGIYRTVYYLPSIFGGSVAIAVLWRFLFNSDGLVNHLLSTLGIPGLNWLTDTRYALFTVSLVTVWEFGSSMVIFLAGLKQIPTELYESAQIDGASIMRRFVHITLPQLSPTILFNLLIQTINALQEFTTVSVVTNGGPVKSTYLYQMLIYDNAFQFHKMGYASALSWLLFGVVLLFTAVLFASTPLWLHYGDGGDKLI